jgi:hypothetical protein
VTGKLRAPCCDYSSFCVCNGPHTPQGFESVRTSSDFGIREFKSPSKTKRSALYDRFCLHGLQGYPYNFEDELVANLFTGATESLPSMRSKTKANWEKAGSR